MPLSGVQPHLGGQHPGVVQRGQRILIEQRGLHGGDAVDLEQQCGAVAGS
jgi:hypothetical protein